MTNLITNLPCVFKELSRLSFFLKPDFDIRKSIGSCVFLTLTVLYLLETKGSKTPGETYYTSTHGVLWGPS